MDKSRNQITRFLKDESGATAVEYAVMLGLIIIACIASISLFGNTTQAIWGRNTGSITTALGN